MIDGHGDDSYRYGGRIRHDFSSNIYARADLSLLKEHLSGCLGLIEGYPEPEPRSLERLIAAENGIDGAEVMVTNGATEAIYLVARCYGGGMQGRGDASALMPPHGEPQCAVANVIRQPTFSEYADACRSFGCVVCESDDIPAGRKVYWICNPNNPDGSVTSKDALLRQADEHPEDLFVIDQSYEDYTLMPMIADCEAVCRSNVILIHSMTKRFCVPGLRIGHVTANSNIISCLRAMRHPWSVNALAVEAGKFLIRSGFRAIPDVGAYLEEARRLRCSLNAIDGIDVMPTQTNFMLARISGRKASLLKEYLASEHGILIRDASNFAGLDDSFFRVAAQDRQDNDLLVEAVKGFYKQPPPGLPEGRSREYGRLKSNN